ncbi:MAG: GTPase HflX [Candidatus Eisenbacteria bacterium]|nr:GTPase HflX [Candidatus Eisenbacteria bacterium]
MARPPLSTASRVEKAILVGVDSPGSPQESLDELALLTDTAGARVVDRLIQRRSTIEPSTYLSKGKRGTLAELIAQHKAELVIFDEELSPAQVRNLERDLQVRVVDRSELILDIFARRARTREAMLQVELAQLEYLLPRLTRMWTHLERQVGGIGTRGPGETQLEVDRRRVRKKISILKEKLERIDRERETQRKGRGDFFRGALVGYTNAGKSTLFNALTQAGVLAEDKLFATLDTTTRQLGLPEEQKMLLSDTVGFIRKLPHHLIASFRATLLEVREADLIIHVVDASHPRHEEQIRAVEEVLSEILERDVARLIVLNKIDRLGEEEMSQALRLRHPDAEIVCAHSQGDVARLRDRLARELASTRVVVSLNLPVERIGDVRGILRRGRVIRERYEDGRLHAEYALARPDIERLQRSGCSVKPLPG